MESAEVLYNQLEEELHDLVFQSNSSLERLEFLQKVRELEAEFSKLELWLDGEAAARLQEMGAEEWSPESFLGSDEQFNEFLAQATPAGCMHRREDEEGDSTQDRAMHLVHPKAQYRHGLVLCQEAAEVQDAAFPEAELFQTAAALFRSKLTSFQRQVERRQAERELLRDLGGFSSKVAGLKLGCGQCVVRGKREDGRALRGLQSSFQKLLVEFALEKLQEMKAQVRRMRSSPGLAAWTEARRRYQGTRQALEEMLAELQEAWGAQTEGHGGSLSRPGSGSAAPCEGAPGASPEPEEPPEPGAGPAEPRASSAPSPEPGAQPSSPQPHGHQGPKGDPPRPHRASANTALPRPQSGACPGTAGHLTPASRTLQTHPLTLPARARCPGTDPPCPTAVPHGAVTRGPSAHKRAEYFQVSSQSSFSSEDSDSQNSTEDAPAASLALPRDLQSPRPRCPMEKPPQIIYLENHHSGSPAKANAK